MIPLGARWDLNKEQPVQSSSTLSCQDAEGQALVSLTEGLILDMLSCSRFTWTVYTERRRITIQRSSNPPSLTFYQIVPVVVVSLPAYHPVCIVNRLLIDVQGRTGPFGTADVNYSNTMTCRSEIKAPIWSGRYWIMSVLVIEVL